MLNRDKLARLSLVALAAVATTATAQMAPAPDKGETAEMQEIVVTGSMIRRPDAETAEAVTTITMDSLKALGVTTVEQALQQISANQSSAFQVASSVSTFTGGGSFANLRGLGADHTLILLDGQRLSHKESARRRGG